MFNIHKRETFFPVVIRFNDQESVEINFSKKPRRTLRVYTQGPSMSEDLNGANGGGIHGRGGLLPDKGRMGGAWGSLCRWVVGAGSHVWWEGVQIYLFLFPFCKLHPLAEGHVCHQAWEEYARPLGGGGVACSSLRIPF